MNQIETHTIDIDGRAVRYYSAGQGEPLVVVHGGGGDARSWERNIVELSRNYTVYVPDLPGYGGSLPLDGDYFIPELSDFMYRFTEGLGLETFHLMGHSLGGGIALNFALKFPARIRKLVLISSLCIGNEIAFWVRWLSLPAIIKMTGGIVLGTLKAIKWIYERLTSVEYVMPMSAGSVYVGGHISTFHSQRLVLEEHLADVSVPTLVVWGAKDIIVPVKHAYKAAKAIKNSVVKIFENVGHDVHRDELKSFSLAVAGFLG